jgi:integrase
MNHTEFAVSRFENRNGVTSWRVEGKLHGLRIRKNFKTREEAAAEQAALELKSLQIASGLRPVMSSLTEDQVREAEALFWRVAGRPLPLSSYVDFALANYREPEKQKRLGEAVAEYVASKKHEYEQDLLSISQFSRIGRDLKRLQKDFPGASVADLTVQKLVGYFEHGRPALKTYNNRRGIVSTFLKFAFLRGWIAENPIAKVPQHRIRRRRGMAATLSAAQVRALMEHMETLEGGRWVPYFALCLFAGIRPSVPHGEITKLKPEAVDLDAGVISISAEVSKVREPRKVVIQPNLAAWLRAYPLERFPLVVTNFYERRARIGKEFALTHDVMRHTFISMFVAKFRSIGEAAIQAGNSEGIIRRHYLDLKSAEEAKEFWGILPQRTASAANVVPLVPSPVPVRPGMVQAKSAA